MIKERKQRLRFGRLPEPSKRAALYWGTSQPELQGLTDADLTRLIVDSQEFATVLGGKLDQIDKRNGTLKGTQAGRPPRWSARQLETVLVYRRVAGLPTTKRALERLRCDTKGRALLGLGGDLPSSPTLTRHLRQHFDAGERAKLYRELDRQLRQRVTRLPDFDQEARILGMDGSHHGTRYTAPIPERGRDGELTGKIVNGDIPIGEPGAITAPDAGYVGGTGPKSGKGWQFVGLWSEHGTLLSWDISPLHHGEREAARRVLGDYEREILPHRNPGLVSVCAADGGFSSPALRQQLQELRIVPNIHKASHGSATAKTQAAKLDRQWAPFFHPGKPHYGYWFCNGHAEIRCACGEGQTERIFDLGQGGQLAIATKGKCRDCGTVTITAGRWRRAQNPSRYVRAKPADADPAIGNSLTYHDRISRKYGRGRFGWGESVHAVLERRFGLLKPASGNRSLAEVETEFAIAGAAISVLLLERQAQRSGGGTGAAVGTARVGADEAELPVAA